MWGRQGLPYFCSAAAVSDSESFEAAASSRFLKACCCVRCKAAVSNPFTGCPFYLCCRVKLNAATSPAWLLPVSSLSPPACLLLQHTSGRLAAHLCAVAQWLKTTVLRPPEGLRRHSEGLGGCVRPFEGIQSLAWVASGETMSGQNRNHGRSNLPVLNL